MTEQEKYILKMKIVTNWRWNSEFLGFYDKFYKNKPFQQVRRAFDYYANKLVKKGFLLPAKKVRIGYLGFTDFGTRTQTIWEHQKTEQTGEKHGRN